MESTEAASCQEPHRRMTGQGGALQRGGRWLEAGRGGAEAGRASIIKASAGVRPLPPTRVMGFLLMRNLERECGPHRTSEAEGTDQSVHAKSAARELGCRAPEDREFNLAFSLAEIFGINKRISLEPTLLHSESSFTRVGRGKTLTHVSEV